MSTKWGACMSTKVNMNRASDEAVWHAMSQARVVAPLATDPEKGLSLAEASAGFRNMEHRPNRLPEGSKWGPFTRFFVQLNSIVVYVLLHRVLQADAEPVGRRRHHLCGFAIIVLNALLGFIQKGKAERTLDLIRNMLYAEAQTMRSGETRMIPEEQLVPGDVVLLQSGDKIPADLRLIEAKNLSTEEAALTVDRVRVNATVGDRGDCGVEVPSFHAPQPRLTKSVIWLRTDV